MKNNNLFRWVIFIPGSLLIGFLVMIPFHLVLYSTLLGLGILEVLRPIETFLTPIIVMITATIFSYKISPKYKFQSSVVLAMLWCVFIIFAPFLFSRFNLNIFLDIRTLFTFLGIIGALYFNWIKNKRDIKLSINK